MDCHSAKSLMHALAVKSLSAKQTAELTEHITNCPRCAEDMSRYQEMERRIVHAIRAWRRISAPETLRDKVHRALETGDTSLVATVKKDLSVPHLAPKVAVVGRRREKVWKHRSISLRPRWARLRRWGAVAAAATVLIVALLLVRGREEDAPPREVAVAQEEAPAPVGERVAVVQERAAPPRAESGVEVTEQPKLEEVAPEREPERVAEVPSESRQAPKVAEKPADAQPSIMETERPVIRLALIAGSIYHKRRGAGKWSKVTKAAEGIYLERGDSLDTRSGRARIELEGVGSVCCNRNTWLVFDEDESGCRLHKGEVCCELGGKKANKMRFEVASASGVVRHLGTRFSVKVTPAGTTVTVAEGRVEVENEKGRAEVEGGFQLRVRKGRKAGRPRKVDAERLLAWMQELRPQEVVLFREDFERRPLGRKPGLPWVELSGPAAGGRIRFLLGEWAVEKDAGNRVLRQKGAARAALVIPDKPWKNYALRVRVKVNKWSVDPKHPTRPEGDFSIGVRFGQGRKGVCFWTKQNGLGALTSLEDGTHRTQERLARPLREGEWHALRLEVRGNRASVFLDERPVLHGDMTGAVAGGGIFIGAVNCDVSFDDITAKEF